MVGDQERDKKKVLGTTLRARDRRARDRNNAATVAAVAVATAAAANGRGHASTGGPPGRRPREDPEDSESFTGPHASFEARRGRPPPQMDTAKPRSR